MFKEIQKIGKVKAFAVGDYLCCLQQDKGIVCSNGFEYQTDSNGSLYSFGSILLKQSYRGDLQIFHAAERKLLFENDRNKYKLFIIPDTGLIGDTVYVTRKMEGAEEIGLLNFYSGSFEARSKTPGILMLKHQLGINWGGTNRGVEVRSLAEGKFMWSFADFQNYSDSTGTLKIDEVRNFLGVYKLTLWFGLSSGKLIGLDAQTGHLVSELGFRQSDLPSFPYKVREGDYLPFGEFMQLNEKEGELIGLRQTYFMKVSLDASSLKREYTDVSDSMTTHSITSSYRNYTFPLIDGQLCFCDDKQNKIGVFDCDVKKVVWSKQLDKDISQSPIILEMKYFNGKLCILESSNTLHVLERI
jgi:hypothetical protein